MWYESLTKGAEMDMVAWLGVISGIISIVAFLFAVWVWLRSDIKVRELTSTIRSAYDVTGTILWEMQAVRGEDSSARLRQLEKALGVVSALHVMTGKLVKTSGGFRETDIGRLMERGVIWSPAMLNEIESARETREIWLVTPDLEPDLSDRAIGNIVAANLRAGKHYVYFYPDDIPNIEAEKTRMLSNIGALSSPKLKAKVTLVPIGQGPRRSVITRGNTILFFRGDPEWDVGQAFEEVVFTGVSARGLFWQEHAKAVAQEMHSVLNQELKAQQTGTSP